MKECSDDSKLFFAHEKIDIEASHPCSYGGAKDFVDVSVYEIKDAVLEDEVEDCANYIRRWTVSG